MLARVLAYCINAQEGLSFTKGLSEVEEPDIWVRSFDEKINLWIEIGEPMPDRIKKARRLSENVKVYSFNSKSPTWWEQGRNKFLQINAQYYRFEHSQIVALAAMLERTMDLSVTITGDSAYIAAAKGEVEVAWSALN